MRKLRVGVWLHGKLTPEFGGAYGYYQELVNALSTYTFKDAEIVFLSNGMNYADHLDYKRITWMPRRQNMLKFLLNIVSKFHPLGKRIKKLLEQNIAKEKEKLHDEIYQYADVIYYLTQSCVYPDFPFIYTLWDLGHVNTYAFPELSANGAFEERRDYHDTLCHKALMIFAESETGKKECEKYLNITENKIRVVPIFPSGIVHKDCESKKPEMIEHDCFYIHYPSQFWSHKNHYNLLEAMPTIIKTFPEIKLVLTGTSRNNKEYISKIISAFKLEDHIRDLGFVSIQELRWLYEHSQGLVMPTLLGPTNMPPLEAAELSCPVACSNLPGHREQLGNYGYYFNGLDPQDIAEKIVKMITDKKHGTERPYEKKFSIDHALRSIDASFTELRPIRFCWGK